MGSKHSRLDSPEHRIRLYTLRLRSLDKEAFDVRGSGVDDLAPSPGSTTVVTNRGAKRLEDGGAGPAPVGVSEPAGPRRVI